MRTDVLILGAGLEGCSTAIAAREAGLTVVVIECELATFAQSGSLQLSASAAGAILIDAEPRHVIKDGYRVIGVNDGMNRYFARWTLDATGRRAWLAQALNLNRPGEDWELAAFHEAWDYQKLGRTPGYTTIPDGESARGGLDMNWRMHPAAAGAGYFLLDEAAATLASGGSFCSLASSSGGALSVRLMQGCLVGLMSEAEAAAAYMERVNHQFFSRAATIRERRAGPLNVDAARAISRARGASAC